MFPTAHANGLHFRPDNLRWTAGLLIVLWLAALSGCSNFAAQARNAEGVRLYRQGQFQAALQQFQEATYADPSNPDGYYNLAATYHRLGRLQQRQSYLDQAENYYNQCLDHHPNHVECYRGLAVLLAQQDRKAEAFRLIEGWVQREPSLADPKIELARLSEEYGDSAAAKDHLTAALQVDPDNARALAALGKIREDMGDRAQAIADYQRSLARDRFQPQVAARVSSLRSAGNSAWSVTSGGETERVADRQSTPLR